MRLQCQRDAFGIPDDLHFLNCAYLGPTSLAVEAAGRKGLARKRVPAPFPSAEFFEDSDRLRARFATLVGGGADRIAILPSVSYGIALAARNLPVGPGEEIVVLGEQFPSNYYAWERLASERSARVRVVSRPDGPPPRSAEWNRRILDAIGPRTAIVALGAVHWTDGTRFDLRAIAAAVRASDACLVVDGSQAVGAMPIDVGEMRPDLLVTAGYKWMLGPYSTALAWLGPRFDDGVPLEETWIARRGSEDFRRLVEYRTEYGPGAVRFDVGQRSDFIRVPMLLTAIDQLLEWTPAGIEGYIATLLDRLVEPARDIGARIEPSEGRARHMLGIELPDSVDTAALEETLQRAGVHVSLRGSALRVSPNVYNREQDIDALLEVLTAIDR